MSPLPEVFFDVARNPVLAGMSRTDLVSPAHPLQWVFPLVLGPSVASSPVEPREATGTP
jgi:hypothetical protein